MPKAVELLVDELLPEDMRGLDRSYDKKGITQLIRDVSNAHPERYAALVNGLKDIGRTSVYLQGTTLKLDDFEPGFDKQVVLDEMDEELRATSALKNDEERKLRRFKIYADYAQRLTDLSMESGRAKGSGLAGIIASGARGNPAQYRAMITTPATYTDYKDEPIDMFVRKSFAEGIRPMDFLASTFGTRKSVLATKNATADAGDLSKMMTQAALPVIVTQRKSTTDGGILLDPKEDEIRGRVLARDTAGYKRGTPIDREVEQRIRAKHKGRIMVYSPISEISEEGISGEAFGVNYDGIIPGPGFAAGHTSATAIGEPIAQGSLNTKHSGGAFTGGKKEFSGFDYISQFVQVPESFKDRAAVSEVMGRVESITEAPQGGSYITVAGEKHYVLPGMEPKVKVGEEVEPGDALSDGIVNPRDVIRLRGLGEGRKYYSRRLKRLLDDSGQPAALRNVEVITRGALDAVRITDDDGHMGYLPDDVVSYNKLAAQWRPRPGHKQSSIGIDTQGKYLEQPLLHYTIGTQLTPRMNDELKEAGYTSAMVHDEPPPFEPLQIRLRTTSYETSEDWLGRMGSSYLQKSLAESAQRGYDTNIKENVNPYPRLAYGEGFGDKATTTGKF